jgi:phage FluMu protein Com
MNIKEQKEKLNNYDKLMNDFLSVLKWAHPMTKCSYCKHLNRMTSHIDKDADTQPWYDGCRGLCEWEWRGASE